MNEIKAKETIYNVDSSDAIITEHTMIPGIKGKMIDLNLSYKKMKSINAFKESLLTYQEVLPQKSINNIYDKVIISGNKKYNNIGIIININNDFLFNNINQILLTYNIYVDILTNKNYNLLNTNYKNIITENNTLYTDFCLTYNLNINCSSNKKYTILGHLINNYYLSNTKSMVSNGIILVYSFNENNYNELNVIIKYLKNNNYNIVTTNELIKE